MSKSNNKNSKKIISLLLEAFNRSEGEYSAIPQCCIEGYISGRTYMNVRNSLNEKDQKKLEKWNYVPCEKCFKQSKVVKIKDNGTSAQGKVMLAIADFYRSQAEINK